MRMDKSSLKYIFTFLFVFHFSYQIRSQSVSINKSGDNNVKRISIKDSLLAIWNDTSKPDTVRLRAFNKIVWSLMNSAPDTAFILAKKSLIFSKERNLPVFQGKATIAMGAARQTIGNFREALSYYFDALKLIEGTSYRKGLGICYNNIGLIYQNQADYPNALKYYLKSLKNSEDLSDKLGTGESLTNIGNVYLYQKDYEKALKYYNEAAKVHSQAGNPLGEALCLNGIGIVYKYKSDLSKALEYYLKALKIREEIGDKTGTVASYINIGGNYQDQNNYSTAADYYLKGLKIAEELGLKAELSVCYLNLAGLYSKLNDYGSAIKYCELGLNLIKESGDINNERLAYEILSYSYSKKNNYKLAYEYQQKFKLLTDSIFNTENSRQLSDLKTQYEVEKKETELKIKAEAERKIADANLVRERTIKYFLIGGLFLMLITGFNFYYQRNKQKKLSEQLQEGNLELKKINDSKTKLFSIIGHDIKSPMASIQGYTELIADNEMSFTETEIKEFARTMNMSVKNLNAMLDNILLWSLNESQQLKPQFNVLSINDVIESSINLLSVNAHKKNINVVYKSHVVSNIESDKNILATVIRNILSNAIKFSKSGSDILINSVMENDLVVITVSDSGVGMSKMQIDNVLKNRVRESTSGTDNEKGNGLGLFLCKEFMQKLGGQFLIESKPGVGTTVILKLKPSNFS